MNSLLILFSSLLMLSSYQDKNPGLFRSDYGFVEFRSVAPLETIIATNKSLKGIIDTSKNTFAFTVAIHSFQGFNSPLQQEHFNENYLESGMYPHATFSGKIIEDVIFSTNGVFQVRAKGALVIHGVRQERLIKVNIEIKDDRILVKSDFLVSLSDHEIKIPRIVHQKISPDIEVSVEISLKPNQVE